MKILISQDRVDVAKFSRTWGVAISHCVEDTDWNKDVVYLCSKSVSWRVVILNGEAKNVNSSMVSNPETIDAIKNSFGWYVGFSFEKTFLFGSCTGNIVIFHNKKAIVVERPDLNRVSKYRQILENQGASFSEGSWDNIPEVLDPIIESIQEKCWSGDLLPSQ